MTNDEWPEWVEETARKAMRAEDPDLETFADRHGEETVRAAVVYAEEYVGGKMTHRIMARELALSPLEAGIVLDALRPFVINTNESTGRDAQMKDGRRYTSKDAVAQLEMFYD